MFAGCLNGAQSTFVFYLIRCSEVPPRGSGALRLRAQDEADFLTDLLQLCLWALGQGFMGDCVLRVWMGHVCGYLVGVAMWPLLLGEASEGPGESGAAVVARSETKRVLKEQLLWD